MLLILKLEIMENKSKAEEPKQEEKIGIVPASQIKGSDADKDHKDETPLREVKKQVSGSDADEDKQNEKY